MFFTLPSRSQAQARIRPLSHLAAAAIASISLWLGHTAAHGAEKQPAAAAAKKQTQAPAQPSLAPVQDVAGLPRVLLIGDSISMGYTLPVRQRLQGIANVHRIPQNGGPTKNGVANIDRWLGAGTGQWAVIHFNWGIHDLKYMPDGKRQVEPTEYEANLRKLLARLKQTGAVLIWATTTPIPSGPLIPPRQFGQVAEYNAIAEKVMKENGVRINDLNARITPKLGEYQKKQDVHYHNAGSEWLADQVAQEIKSALGK